MTMSRRGFMRVTYATTGVVTLLTAGQTIGPLKDLALLAPRRPDIGPQQLPVNRTASQARITPALLDAFTLTVEGPRPLRLTLAELQALPQHDAQLPISCVEGWSASATWTGVRVRDLLRMAGVAADTRVRVESLEKGGAYATSKLSRNHAQDPLTLLALKVRGEQLLPDHGYPCRLIAPNRPGVLQTKWVTRLVQL